MAVLKSLLFLLALNIALNMAIVSTSESKGKKREVKRLVQEQNSVLLNILDELKQENLRQNKLERVLDAILTCQSCSRDAQCTRAGDSMKCSCGASFLGDGTRCVADQFASDDDFLHPGLPPFRNSWYFLSNVKASWEDARKICRRHGADLADLSDHSNDDVDNRSGEEDEEEKRKNEGLNAEWRHVFSSMAKIPGGASTFFWLGSHSVSAGATPWRWLNSSAPLEIFHASWRDGKPQFGSDKCLLMQDINSFAIEDSWRDYRCTAKFRFLCEIHIPPVELTLGGRRK